MKRQRKRRNKIQKKEKEYEAKKDVIEKFKENKKEEKETKKDAIEKVKESKKKEEKEKKKDRI